MVRWTEGATLLSKAAGESIRALYSLLVQVGSRHVHVCRLQRASLRELRFQRQHIVRATMEAIGLSVEDGLPLDVLRERTAAARPDVAAKLDAFLAADDVLFAATENDDIPEGEYATAVTRRTMARNSSESTAKMLRPEGRADESVSSASS